MSTDINYAPDCPLPDTLLAATDSPWRLRTLAAVRLQVEREDSASRLHLWVDVQLVGRADSHARLQLQLRSSPWQDSDPVAPPLPELTQVAPGSASQVQPLSYDIVAMAAADAAANGFWQQYLTPGQVQSPPANTAGRAESLDEALRLALGRWLAHSLEVVTLEGAQHYALHGPVGHFGPVQAKVLERTGQADLAVEVTPLGETRDAAAGEGVAQIRLQLYGERQGAWLLHRCVPQAQKARRNDAAAPARYHCDVLVAESAAQLVQLAGLGALEKPLFQAAGILPHAVLRQPRGAEASDAAAPQLLDISRVPDRSRRYLQAIAALAQQEGLNHGDMDLLLRLARQLARARPR